MQLPFTKEECAELVRTSNESTQYPSKRLLYYLHTYDAIKQGNIKVNFAALIFGPFWLFYRKAYLYAFLAIIIQSVLSSGSYGFYYGAQYPYYVPFGTFGFSFLPAILYGIFGNNIYFHFLSTQYENGVRRIGVNKIILLLLFPFVMVYGFIGTILFLIFGLFIFIFSFGIITLFFGLGALFLIGVVSLIMSLF